MDRILAQAQQLDSTRNQLSQQFNNNFDLQKEIYGAKAQALRSAKDLGAQLVGQEQLQAAEIGIPIAYKGIQAARKIYKNPEAFKSGIRNYAKNLIKQKTGVDVDKDIPQSVEEARQAVQERVPSLEELGANLRARVEGAARARGIPTSQAELEQRVRDVVPDVPTTGSGAAEGTSLSTSERNALEKLGAGRNIDNIRTPQDLDQHVDNVFNAVEEHENNMKKFDSLPDNAKQLFTRDLNRGTLPDLEDTDGSLNPNSVVKHSEVLNNLLDTYGTKGRGGGRAPFFEAPASRPLDEGDAEFRAFQEQQRGLLAPAEPRGRVAQVGGFRTDAELPTGPTPNEAFTYQAPTRAQGLAQVAEENRLEAIRNMDLSQLKPLERPQSLSEQITSLKGHTLNPTTTRVRDPITDIEPSDIGLQLPRVEATSARGAIPVSRARSMIFGERDFPPPPRSLRRVPTGVTEGEPTEGGLRGDQTIARALPQSSQGAEAQPKPTLQPLAERQAEPAPRPAIDEPEEIESTPFQQPRTLSQTIQRTPAPQPAEEPKPAPVEEAPKPAPAEGGIEDFLSGIERSGETVAKQVAKTAAETLPEEAGLDLIPGLGEIVMAGTLIGSLVKGEKEAKEQRAETPGPPPSQAPPPPTPQMAFDAAPSLNTATYHQY